VEAARPATIDDVGSIVEMSRAMRAELASYRGGDLWAREQKAAELDAAVVASTIEAADAAVLVGSIDDVVLGFGICRAVTLADGARIGVISELFVEPGAREVGVGETLVDRIVAWCTEHECIGIDATALPGHRAAKNFFEEHGFVARSLTMHRALGDGD
jgi:GNAT superfamily N-acetyltransferase